MNPPTVPTHTVEQLDSLAVGLVQQSAALSRVVFSQLELGISRSEAGVLARLEAGPERVTTLAELDGLAQPTMTLLVKRLEELGHVTRARSAEDGRVVLVTLTPAGHEALESVRASYRELLRERLGELPANELDVLETAVGVITSLLERLQKEGSR